MIIQIDEEMKDVIKHIHESYWGESYVIVKSRKIDLMDTKGFAWIEEDEIKGIIHYIIYDKKIEIVALVSLASHQGIGRKLINHVEKIGLDHKCDYAIVVTTNDNTHAIRFYQRIGYTMSGLYLDSVNLARMIKSTIPLYGEDDIPIEHEIEFKKVLGGIL